MTIELLNMPFITKKKRRFLSSIQIEWVRFAAFFGLFVLSGALWIQAAAAAQTAAKSIADMQNPAEDSEESSKEEEGDTEQESQDEDDKQRKAALEKLEKASEDSFLGQASHKSNHKGLIFIYIIFRYLCDLQVSSVLYFRLSHLCLLSFALLG